MKLFWDISKNEMICFEIFISNIVLDYFQVHKWIKEIFHCDYTQERIFGKVFKLVRIRRGEAMIVWDAYPLLSLFLISLCDFFIGIEHGMDTNSDEEWAEQ